MKAPNTWFPTDYNNKFIMTGIPKPYGHIIVENNGGSATLSVKKMDPTLSFETINTTTVFSGIDPMAEALAAGDKALRELFPQFVYNAPVKF